MFSTLTLDRLLELAGRTSAMLTEMSHADAVRIFTRNGVNPEGMDAASLKAAHRKLVLSNHPDKGGDEATMKDINAAFDVLKKGGPSSAGTSGAGSAGGFGSWGRSPGSGSAGYGRGGRQDFTNIDYIKSYFEEKAYRAPKYTFCGLDGAFIRHSFSVPMTNELIPEAVKALVTWQTKGGNPYPCDAVLMHPYGSQNPVNLVWYKGEDLTPGYELPENDSFNFNISNDQRWMRKLPQWIEDIMAQHRG